MKTSIVGKIKQAPQSPGIYVFYSKNKPLYVGKAVNLKNRLKSYLKITDIKTRSLHEEANRLSYAPLKSEIEALIEESRLIKELKPKYNILWRDDKSYYYVAFSKEKFPKIFITHRSLNLKSEILNPEFIGPFTDGAALRLALKIIRRYLPYCTCLRPHLRDCLNAQIGKCLGFCCKKEIIDNANQIKQCELIYKKNVKAIKMILRGQSKKLLKALEKSEERLALEKIFEHKKYLTDLFANSNAFVVLDRLYRAECYDISNLAGREAVGALTVLVKKDGAWESDKNSYRKFKIKYAPSRDDPRMIAEVLERRLRHAEWPYPDLIIIDGGIAQYKAAQKVLNSQSQILNIRLISFAKPQKLVYGLKSGKPTPLNQLPKEFQELIESAIYQTHHFVIRYHRQVRRKKLFD